MRQFLVAYAICTAALLGLFVLMDGLAKLEYFLKQPENLFVVLFRYFLAFIPVYFTQFLGPVFTLMAAMFSVTMLNKGSEFTPMKAAGRSIQRLLAPYFVMAALSALAMIFVQELVIPNLKDQIRVAFDYGKRKKGIEASFTDSRGTHFKVDEYLPSKQQGFVIEVTKLHPNTGFKTEIVARSMRWVRTENSGYWILEDAREQQWDAKGREVIFPGATGKDRITLASKEVPIDDTDMQPIDLESSDREIPYLSLGELRDQYKRRPQLKHLEVMLHMRLAFPMANFVLLLLGLPFALRGENRSVILGVIAATVISAAYLFSTTICMGLGSGNFSPMLAAWLPVLFFGSLGVTLYSGMNT